MGTPRTSPSSFLRRDTCGRRRPGRRPLAAPGAIAIVDEAHVFQVASEVYDQALWKYGLPVLVAFAGLDDQAAPVEVDVLHPQVEALAQPEPGAVDDGSCKPVSSLESAQDSPDLFY